MSPTTDKLYFFCTNTAFLMSQVPLASFVPKKKQPYQDVKTPFQVTPDDYSTRPDEAYDVSHKSSSDSIFSILATKLTAVSHQQGTATAMRVSTVKGGKVYTLNNPDEIFEAIVFGEAHGEDMKNWFERCVRKKWKPRFVVGLRTLVDASVSDDSYKATDNHAAVAAPLSVAQGDSFGAMGVEFRAGHQSRTDMQAGLTLSNERIYSICYWKVHISHRNGKMTPKLRSQKNVWRAFYSTRGNTEKETDAGSEEIFEASLEGHDDDVAGWEVKETMAPGKNTIYFAFNSETSDEDDEHI